MKYDKRFVLLGSIKDDLLSITGFRNDSEIQNLSDQKYPISK